MDDKEILTLGEVAELLQISERTVIRLAVSKKIPAARKVGRKWRFSRRGIEQWFNRTATIGQQ